MKQVLRLIAKITAFIRGLSFRGKVILAVAIFACIAGFLYLSKGSSVTPAETTRLRNVSVAKIRDIENNSVPLPLVGQVKSVSQASIRAESAGSITQLYHRLGDYVAAGSVIAEIENSSQRAALLQAEGALESAKAGVDKSDKLFGETKRSAINTIRTVYSSNDDVVRAKLDVLFRNPTSDLPVFVLFATDSGLITKVQNSRAQIRQILADEAARAAALSDTSDVDAEIAHAISDTRLIKQYVDDVSGILNTAIASGPYTQTIIDGYITVASLQRAAVSASVASLTASSQALIAAQTDSIAPDAPSASDAAIKSAQGAYNAAKANYEKTVIRAPISGTLNNLALNRGDFVSTFQEVAIVSNNSALEIVAYVTPDDRTQLRVGAPVKIENEFTGSIVSIAPAIDPTTRKIEVKISFAGTIAGLTNGESVHLDISRTPKPSTIKSAAILVPISAVKIQADESVLFTVGQDKKLIAQAVTTGKLIGDKIEILTNIDRDMEIVTDARGLKNGQEVSVQ